MSDTLSAANIEHAATGLAAAWQMTHFAMFRIATFFVKDMPTEKLKAKLNFREDERAGNLWFAVPNDDGVFLGAAPRDGILCVHPVQAYVDLKGHPERAKEAAEELRSKLLSWQQEP